MHLEVIPRILGFLDSWIPSLSTHGTDGTDESDLTARARTRIVVIAERMDAT
jgi:hypothetical protein